MKNKLENNTELFKELIVIINSDASYQLDWQITGEKSDKSQEKFELDLYNRYLENSYEALFYLGFLVSAVPLSDSLKFLKNIANTFIKQLSMNPEIELLRENIHIEPEKNAIEKLIANAPYMSGSEHISIAWFEKIWQNLENIFISGIKSFNGTVEDYLATYNPNIHVAGRVFFHLVESKNEQYPFAFLATYANAVSKEGKSKHVPLKNALMEFGKSSSELLNLLSAVYRASNQSILIEELLETGEIFHPLNYTAKEAYTFLKEIPLYEDAGILCRIPNWWKNKSESVSLSVKLGEKASSRLGFNALVDFNAQLSLGGEPISAAEIKKLLSETEGLVLIKGKWVEVNHSKLRETLEAYEQAQKLAMGGEMSILDAMKFQLNASKVLSVDNDSVDMDITNGKWLDSVIGGLTKPETIDKIECSSDFTATLRSYQERGLSWLHYMKTLGLGACLADDMGLGKTIQVIALLDYIRSKDNEKALLVVPASLIGNWINEINKFAPALSYCILHPSEKKNNTETDVSSLLNKYQLFITTYGMLLKHQWLNDTIWDTFIVDEAQSIKNPASKQTRVAKQIKSKFRIAMTGTPIENRLSDLWSLFDFLNKGLLGSIKEFSNFAGTLKESMDGYSKLKRTVSPFILRRLKTDKNIITDLPDKIEMKTYATLTKKQVSLYSELVANLKEKLENSSDNIQRRGLVLSSIMKFKQICNHPDQYLGQGFYSADESGKYERLREICETIYEKRERVLVFTQFKEITGYLCSFLEEIFMHKGLVLHGETAVSKRQEIVSKFQSHEYIPFLVLSIKAGGVGLNLTNANHVIHFDRWWNPAVENQATDRAFRIGQKKNVLVHKFITKGTIEEKIDLMIEDKIKLSKDIIPDISENWITDMSNTELLNMFKLTV